MAKQIRDDEVDKLFETLIETMRDEMLRNASASARVIDNGGWVTGGSAVRWPHAYRMLSQVVNLDLQQHGWYEALNLETQLTIQTALIDEALDAIDKAYWRWLQVYVPTKGGTSHD